MIGDGWTLSLGESWFGGGVGGDVVNLAFCYVKLSSEDYSFV